MFRFFSKRGKIIAFFFCVLFISFPGVALGNNNGPFIDIGSQEEFFEVLGNIAVFLFSLFLIATVLFFLYAAFTYFTSAGDPEKAKTAQNMIKHGLIAVVIALLAWSVVSLVASFLDPEYWEEEYESRIEESYFS